MRLALPCSVILVVLAVASPPAALEAGVRVVTEADGTIRVTNRGSEDRAQTGSRARIDFEDGVMNVRLGAGVIVDPRPDLGQYDAAFKKAAARYGLQKGLLKAVARVESAFDPFAVSHAGAQGLMQLMPATARAMNVTDPFDPVQSIEGGARYLRKMIDRFEDLELALAAYNAGPDAVERHGGIPPFAETRRYVRMVLNLLQREHEAAARMES